MKIRIPGIRFVIFFQVSEKAGTRIRIDLVSGFEHPYIYILQLHTCFHLRERGEEVRHFKVFFPFPGISNRQFSLACLASGDITNSTLLLHQLCKRFMVIGQLMKFIDEWFCFSSASQIIKNTALQVYKEVRGNWCQLHSSEKFFASWVINSGLYCILVHLFHLKSDHCLLVTPHHLAPRSLFIC